MKNDTIHPIGDRILAVGPRQWPAEIFIETIDHGIGLGEPMWYHRRQARVWFESGWGVSIIWGSGAYGSNHDKWTETINEEPTAVECGITDDNGLLGHRVAGYMNADDVNDLLTEVSRWPTQIIMTLPAHLEDRFG